MPWSEAGLLPGAALLAPDNPERVAWERETYGQEDPYSLRSRALQERLDPHEIGRAFVHLNQRRGFKSNRKTDRARKKEDSEMLAEISELANKLGERTLGQYLAELRGGDPKRHHLTRLRGRHTRRAMYEREFDEIWATQQKHHPDLLTDQLRDRIRRVVFFQRPLLPPPASLIGRCELDERLPRCSRADRRAQRFRLYLEVNNLRVIDTSARLERALDGRRTEDAAQLRASREGTQL